MPKVDRLTEKMKEFCREYVSNGGNGTQAYLTAYDSNSETSASIEASKLLRRDDITEYIATLNKPMENRIQNEREKKRKIIWDRIAVCIENGNDSAVARYMDILNKMDSEYININKNVDDTKTAIDELDVDTLRALASPVDESNSTE
jgi:phage terminase small subunit